MIQIYVSIILLVLFVLFVLFALKTFFELVDHVSLQDKKIIDLQNNIIFEKMKS